MSIEVHTVQRVQHEQPQLWELSLCMTCARALHASCRGQQLPPHNYVTPLEQPQPHCRPGRSNGPTLVSILAKAPQVTGSVCCQPRSMKVQIKASPVSCKQRCTSAMSLRCIAKATYVPLEDGLVE